MKNGVYTIAVCCLLGCNSVMNKPTRDDLVRASAEKLLKSKMGAPQSYEFVSLLLVDSVTYADNIKAERDLYRWYLRSISGDKAKDRRMIAGINAIEKSLGAKVKETASYTYHFTFRNKNLFDAKVLNTYIVQTKAAPTYEVINMASDRDKLYMAPNEFPGFEKLSKQVLGY